MQRDNFRRLYRTDHGLRIYPGVDFRPPRRPPILSGSALAYIVLVVGVLVALSLSGCTYAPGQAVDGLQAKRDAIGPLAEAATVRNRQPSYDFAETPAYQAPLLPTAAEAWTHVSDDIAPTWEPPPLPIAPQNANAGPCGPNGCQAPPPRFLFRRRRG